MATSTFRNKNLVRPVKRGKAKRQRVKAQKRRLIGLGVAPEQAEKLDYATVRTLLKRPAKAVKAVAQLA